MKPKFKNNYQAHGSRFEFKSDNHWNELGHRLAFQSLLAEMGI